MKNTIKKLTKTIIGTIILTASLSAYYAENGDLYGVDNDGDGRIETIYVNSYYKSDGTYVRSHYRATPR